MISFADFYRMLLAPDKLEPTLGQDILARVAFGTENPCDLEDPRERALAAEMFNGVSSIPDDSRHLVVLRLGRGSGKTSMCAAYSLYAALTADLSRVGPGDVPVVVTCAPNKDTAALSVSMASGMLANVPKLKRCIVKADEYSITLKRPTDGRKVSIRAFAASRGGSTVRGRSIISFLFDESEFFCSDNDTAVINDKDIYRAIIPRLLPGGKGFFISTPWDQNTLMAELFESDWGDPKRALVAKAPTLVMRPDEQTAKLVALERERDPDNAAREFDCDASKAYGGAFFDPRAVDIAVDPDLRIPHPSWPMECPVAIGADFGFKHDASAIVVVGFDGEAYSILDMLELKPDTGPLVPSEVVRQFAAIAKKWRCYSVISDQYYREAMREFFQEYDLGLRDAPHGMRGKQEVYLRTRAMLHQGKIRLPKHKQLCNQLKEITHKPTSTGNIQIRQPRKRGGGHCDLVSAWTLAVHDLERRVVEKREKEPEWGTQAWFSKHAKMLREQERRWEQAEIREAEEDARAQGILDGYYSVW